MMRRLVSLILLLATPATAQEAGEPAPMPGTAFPAAAAADGHSDAQRPRQAAGATLPLRATRHLRYEASAGTWMSLDRTPDGKRLVFDLLGDLYTVAASGGRATRIAGGLPFETQPTFSPDGHRIAYVSDRSGADNMWIADRDGRYPRQISFGDDDTVLTSPAWAPDGTSIYVSRYRPSFNAYELWRYDLDGVETLIVPIRSAPNAPRDTWLSTLGAVVSPDGRFVYAARHVGGLDLDDVDNWTIVRRDIASGTETTIVAEPDGPRTALDPGAFFRPALSPDGRVLAYGRRLHGQTELRVRDLQTGQDRRLAFPIERDQVEASMWQDILPRYAFTPDGQAILIAIRGRIERIAIATGAVTPIAFTAPVDLAIGPSTRQDIRERDGPVRARLMMAPVASPDGKSLAFSALGRLYTMALDGHSAPVVFRTGSDPTFQPSWSPDGRQLTWVSWSERAGGTVWRGAVDGSGSIVRLSDVPAYYSYPVFTPDGASVLAVRSPQQARLDLYMEYGATRDASLVQLPTTTGAARVVTSGKLGGRPQFARAPGIAYLLADDGLDAVDLQTGKRTLAAAVAGPGWYFQDGPVPVDDIRISPDGHWLLALVSQQLHLVAMPLAGGSVDLSDPGLRHRRVTSAGADYFEWSADGRTIEWSTGHMFHAIPLNGVAHDATTDPGWSADAVDTRRRDYAAFVDVPAMRASGTLLLRGARVMTMAAGDRVIDHGDILVSNGRFSAVGPTGSITPPPGTRVVDMTGKTILPGFIDTHDHIATVRRGVLGLEDWGLRARLAYGVTTSFDPSTLTNDMLAYQDLLDSGAMTGPRLRQTGVALFSMQRFASLADVRAVLSRYRDDYGLSNIKEYRTGNRRVREWVVQGVREFGLQPTTEGALSMKLDLSQIIDGYAGNEHALVATPLQGDVLRLLAYARTSYTGTLEITNGGPPGQDWSIVQDDPHDDARLAHFWPEVALDQMTLRRTWRRLDEYRFPSIAADLAALQRRGGLVGIGSHGEMPGIGFHYEMEAHAVGGMSPLAVLHAATIGSAETIGRKSDLGSIEPGKLADLVVLDRDPSNDLHLTRHPVNVMRDGRLYDGATLDEIWPDTVTLSRPWFASGVRQWLPQGEPR